MFLITSVEMWVGKFTNVTEKGIVSGTRDLFSTYTPMMVFQALHWMPQEGAAQKSLC